MQSKQNAIYAYVWHDHEFWTCTSEYSFSRNTDVSKMLFEYAKNPNLRFVVDIQEKYGKERFIGTTCPST
jgi:hypothetical protein